MKLFLFIILYSIALSSCQIIDGLHQFQSGQIKSAPPYPASIANQVCLWHEDGKTYLIGNNSIREVKDPSFVPYHP